MKVFNSWENPFTGAEPLRTRIAIGALGASLRSTEPFRGVCAGRLVGRSQHRSEWWCCAGQGGDHI